MASGSVTFENKESSTKNDGATLGKMYELKLLMLFFQKAQAWNYNFDLGREVSTAGKFDDLVFRYKDKDERVQSRYLQSKHVMDEQKKITSTVLFSSITAKNDTFVHNFRLDKYFLSFMDIKNLHQRKELGELQDLIIFTNVDLDLEELNRNEIEFVEKHDLFLNFSIKGRDSKLYNLKFNSSHKLYKHVKIDWSHWFVLISELLFLIKRYHETKKKQLEKDSKWIIFSEKDSLCERYSWILQKKQIIAIEKNDEIKFHEKFLSDTDLSDEVKDFRCKFLDLGKTRFGWKESELLEEAKNAKFRGNRHSGRKNENSYSEIPTKDLTSEELDEFFEHLVFAVNQPNCNELTTVIKDKELRKSFNSINVAFIASSLQDKLLNWIKNKKGGEGWISSDVSEEFFKEANRMITSKKLVGLGLPFKKQLESIRFKNVSVDGVSKFLQSEKCFLRIKSEQTFLTCAKLNTFIAEQSGYEEEDSCIFLSTDVIKSEEMRKEVMEALKATKCQILLLSCNEEESRVLVKELEETAKNMKIIIIAKNFQDDSNNIIDEGNFLFSDLTTPTQELLLSKEALFQGVSIKLNKIFTSVEPKVLDHIIRGEIITKLILVEEILKIGGTLFDQKVEEEDYYVERTFDFETLGSPDILENDFWSSTLDQRVMILSACAGMGKSTVFTSLSKKLKCINSELWIFKIDLNDYTSVLRKERKAKITCEEEAVVFLREKILKFKFRPLLQSETDFLLFDHYLSQQKKIVILFDGFDEICPDYKSVVLDLVKTLNENKHISKIIVSTRPIVKTQLENKLQVSSCSLRPFSEEEQIRFLIDFWKNKNPDLHDESRIRLYAKHLMRAEFGDARKLMGIPLQSRIVAEIFGSTEDDSENFCWEDSEDDEENGNDEKTKDFSFSESLRTFYFSNKNAPEIFYQVSLTELYKKFIQKRFEIVYKKDKVDFTKLNVSDECKTQFKQFLQEHKLLALKSVIPDYILESILEPNDLSHIQKYIEGIAKGCNRKGFINCLVDQNPQFVHRTFAEYFLAEFVFDHLKRENDLHELDDFIFTEILLKDNYYVVRKFLNGILSKMHLSEECFIAYKTKINKLLLEPMLEHKNSPLHVALAEHNMEIIRFLEICLLGNLHQIIQFQNGNCESPLEVAVVSENIDGCKFLLENGGNPKELCVILAATRLNNQTIIHLLEGYISQIPNEAHMFENKGENFGSESLHFFVQSDNLPGVKLLVEGGGDINELDETRSNVLHRAVELENHEVFEYLVKKGCNINQVNSRGVSVLQAAVSKGRFNHVKCLVENGVDINYKDSFNNNVLFKATEIGDLNIFKYLVHNGINIHERGDEGVSILHKAVRCSRLDIVEYLIHQNVDITLKDKNGNTALHDAALHGELEILKLLLDKKADIHATNNEGFSPLMSTLEYSRLSEMKYLVEKGANVNHKDLEGYTVLHYAAHYRETEILKFFVEQKADVNAINSEGISVLQSATARGLFKNVKFLVENGADVFYKNESGKTALHGAAQVRDSSILEFLIGQGLSVNEACNKGISILQLAVEKNDFKKVEFLVEKGANVNHTDKDGDSVLHYAVRLRDSKILKYLVEKKANINQLNKLNVSVLQLASEKSDLNSVRFLIKRSENVKHKNSIIESALCYAARNPDPKILKFFLEENVNPKKFDSRGRSLLQIIISSENSTEKVEFLLEKGEVDINRKDENGDTALHYAGSYGNEIILKKLLQNGADIHDVNLAGISVLQLAAKSSRQDEVEFLLNEGADIHHQSKDGKTVLHHTAFPLPTSSNVVDTLDILVENGALVLQKDLEGNIPLHYAAQNPDCEILEYLMERGGINETNNEGMTALLLAAKFDTRGNAMRLIKKGARINHKDKLGNTALHHATQKRDSSVLLSLIEKGADIDEVNNEGISVLESAIQGGCLWNILLLVANGAGKQYLEEDNLRKVLQHSAQPLKPDILSFLLEESNEIVLKTCFKGISLLQAAPLIGDLDIIKDIIHNESLFK